MDRAPKVRNLLERFINCVHGEEDINSFYSCMPEFAFTPKWMVSRP